MKLLLFGTVALLTSGTVAAAECNFSQSERAQLNSALQSFSTIKQDPFTYRVSTVTIADKSTTIVEEEKKENDRLAVLKQIEPMLVSKPACANEALNPFIQTLKGERGGKALIVDHVNLDGDVDFHSKLALEISDIQEAVNGKLSGLPTISPFDVVGSFYGFRAHPKGSIFGLHTLLYSDAGNKYENDVAKKRYFLDSDVVLISAKSSAVKNGMYSNTVVVQVSPVSTQFKAYLAQLANEPGQYGSHLSEVLSGQIADLSINGMTLSVYNQADVQGIFSARDNSFTFKYISYNKAGDDSGDLYIQRNAIVNSSAGNRRVIQVDLSSLLKTL